MGDIQETSKFDNMTSIIYNRIKTGLVSLNLAPLQLSDERSVNSDTSDSDGDLSWNL